MKKIVFLSLVFLISTACSAESPTQKSITINCSSSVVTVDADSRATLLIFNGKKIDSGKMNEKCELNKLVVAIDIDLERKDDYKLVSTSADQKSKHYKLVSGRSQIEFKEDNTVLATTVISKSSQQQMKFTSEKVSFCYENHCAHFNNSDLRHKPINFAEDMDSQN